MRTYERDRQRDVISRFAYELPPAAISATIGAGLGSTTGSAAAWSVGLYALLTVIAGWRRDRAQRQLAADQERQREQAAYGHPLPTGLPR